MTDPLALEEHLRASERKEITRRGKQFACGFAIISCLCAMTAMEQGVQTNVFVYLAIACVTATILRRSAGRGGTDVANWAAGAMGIGIIVSLVALTNFLSGTLESHGVRSPGFTPMLIHALSLLQVKFVVWMTVSVVVGWAVGNR